MCSFLRFFLHHFVGCILSALFLCSPTALAHTLYKFDLHFRSAEELLPQLSAFVEEGGVIGGSGAVLFMRTSDHNRREIEQILATLDVPAKSLVIRVRQNNNANQEQGGLRSRVVLRPGANSAQVRATQFTTRSNSTLSQFVRAQEGKPVYIAINQTLTVPFRQIVRGADGRLINDTLVTQTLTSGFYALTRVQGDSVSIEISPSWETPGRQVGSVNSQRLVTSVSGRLGEWIAVGGSDQQAGSRQAGLLSATSQEGEHSREVWLLVETAEP